MDGSAAVRCSVCGNAVGPGVSRCPACKAVVGEANRCPHCRSIADVAPSTSLRFVCVVCGRPRVPMEGLTLARAFPEADALHQAGRDAGAAKIWRVLAASLALFGLLSLCVVAVVAAVVGAGAMLAAIAVLTAAVPLGGALVGLRGSRTRRARVNRSLERGWGQAALELTRLRGGAIDARSFAQVTRIEESEAERILSRISAAGQLTGTIADDGTLRYRLLEASHHVPAPYESPYAPHQR